MTKTLQNIVKWINALNEGVGKLTSWATFLLVLLVCYDVITRYFFSDPQTWMIELEWHLFALIFLFGAGYAFKNDRHVRVDLFYSKMEEKDKALINLIGSLVFLIPWCLIIIYFSFYFGLESYHINETSPDPGGLPARYLIKFAITIGFIFMLLQAIAHAIQAFLELKQPKS